MFLCRFASRQTSMPCFDILKASPSHFVRKMHKLWAQQEVSPSLSWSTQTFLHSVHFFWWEELALGFLVLWLSPVCQGCHFLDFLDVLIISPRENYSYMTDIKKKLTENWSLPGRESKGGEQCWFYFIVLFLLCRASTKKTICQAFK